MLLKVTVPVLAFAVQTPLETVQPLAVTVPVMFVHAPLLAAVAAV